MTEFENRGPSGARAEVSDVATEVAVLDATVLPGVQIKLRQTAELDDLRQELERHLANGAAVPQKVLGEYDSLWRTTFQIDRPVPWLNWPTGLYIPAAADWRNYWFIAPPVQNRYRWQYPVGAETVARADVNDGALYAYAAELPGVAVGENYAIVGATHISPHNLAYATLSARATGVAEHHLLMNLPPAVSGNAKITGSIWLVLWQRNPVDGTWELKRPFASIELFSADGDPSGGGQQTTVGTVPRQVFDYDSGPLSVPILLEGGGREYVVGVEAMVHIDVNIVDGSNHPYLIDRDGGDVWYCWGHIIANVPQIQVEVTKVLVP